MKNIFFVLICFLSINTVLKAQNDSIDTISPDNQAENIYTAGSKTKMLEIDMSNPDEFELALKKIHLLKSLETIVFDGETDEGSLKKIMYRLSVLKNLTAVSFQNNELTKIPDNINTIKSLKSVTVEGNQNLDFNDLCFKLSKTSVNELNLKDNNFSNDPPKFSEVKNLKKINITGSDQLNYENLVDELAKLNELTTLSIPVNYISQLPKNIDKLKALQVLDVSNNILIDLPNEVSQLKAINNLSIHGNLLLTPAKDLEKFKNNEILYLSLDKEISGEEIEQIKRMFPKAEISFPVEEELKEDSTLIKNNSAQKIVDTKKNLFSGELKTKKEAIILSSAYLVYPALFQSIVYNFDTLSFEERYADLRYTNIYQRVNNFAWRGGSIYFRKWLINVEKPGKKNEIWFRFAMNDNNVSSNYPELRAFNGMYWVYQGELSKRKFKKKYLTKRQPVTTFFLGTRIVRKRKAVIRWDDIRIEFDKNNSMFTIHLKSEKGFEKFNAYPVVPNVPIEKNQKNYNRRYLLYEKSLSRRAIGFKKDFIKEKKRYDTNFKKMEDFAWKELQMRMSDKEKIMSKEEWLEYYDNIVANEISAINNSPPLRSFVQRAFTLRNYNIPAPNNTQIPSAFSTQPVNTSDRYGLVNLYCDFISEEGGGKLPVNNIYVIDKKNKTYYQFQGTLGLSPATITLKQYASYCILIELRNGDWGAVSSAEIDIQKADATKTSQLKAKVIDKNLDTIGNLLQESGIQ